MNSINKNKFIIILESLINNFDFLNKLKSFKNFLSKINDFNEIKIIGKGSARIAIINNNTFEIDNSKTVIKIAHNAKGLVQNKNELKFLIEGDKIFPKIYDYDGKKDEQKSYILKKWKMPLWIEIEKLDPISEENHNEHKFFKLLGLESTYNYTTDELIDLFFLYLIKYSNDLKKYYVDKEKNGEYEEYNEINKKINFEHHFNKNENVQNILKLSDQYKLAAGDLSICYNYGIRNDDELVLLDVGLTRDEVKKYYGYDF